MQPAVSPSLQRRNDIEARITAKSQSSVAAVDNAGGVGERSSQVQPAASSSLPNGTNDIETASSGVLQAEVSASLRRLNDAEERIRAKTTSSGGEPAMAQIMEEGDSRRCLDSTVKSVNDTFAMEVPSAVVVGDEVFDAEPISDDVLKGTRAKRWRLAAAAAVLLMVVAIAIMAPLLSKKEEVVVLVSSVAVPSAVPSSAPSFDPSPTLQRVQERDAINCGVGPRTLASGDVFLLKLCRAVAAVVLGSPEKIVKVATDSKTRWTSLLDRLTDLSVFGDTHTIEREIREVSNQFRETAPRSSLHAPSSERVTSLSERNRGGFLLHQTFHVRRYGLWGERRVCSVRGRGHSLWRLRVYLDLPQGRHDASGLCRGKLPIRLLPASSYVYT